MRNVHRQYRDPLEIIWMHAAEQCGMQVQRDPEVFASWNGKGTLRLGTPETLDRDDCLAQMVLHEMCHGLIEGPDQFGLADWGLQYGEPDHLAHEFGALRLQAALSARYGLRDFLASTTDYRAYYDLLASDPLSQSIDHFPVSVVELAEGACLATSDRLAIELATRGLERADQGPWGEPLRDALRRTAEIREVVQSISSSESIWYSESS